MAVEAVRDGTTSASFASSIDAEIPIPPINESLPPPEIKSGDQFRYVLGLSEVFRIGTVSPGETVRRSRFGRNKPFVPVDVISSELIFITDTVETIDAIFIQHQLAVSVDPSILQQREEYFESLERHREEHTFDPNLRYRIPKLTTQEIYERKQSRQNGLGWWSRRSERVAALRVTWQANTEGKDIFIEEYLEGAKLEGQLEEYYRINEDQLLKDDIQSREWEYRDKIRTYSEIFNAQCSAKLAA